MNWNNRIRTAFGSLPIPADDVVEELAQHASAMYAAARAEGRSHEEADRRVAAQIDGWRAAAAALRHKSRRTAAVPPPPSESSSFLSSIVQDTKYAARLLLRQPRFALLVLLTMALGIGSTTTLFTVAYGVLMKPLPWADADRLVTLKETRGGKAPRFGSFTNAAYFAWRDQASTIDEFGAWSSRQMTLSGAGDPERLRIAAVTPSLFKVIGARPKIGTLFGDGDDTAKVAVLSESLWRQRFGGDPGALGKALTLDGESYTIVAVLPDAQAFPDRQSRAWVPFRITPVGGGFLSLLEVVARLRPGVTPAQAAAEGTARGAFAPDTGMTTVAIFGGNGPIEVTVRPMRDSLTAEVRRPLIVLLAAVGLLLLIATTNIASLQLARATSRRREFAIRAALGASGARVVRQLVVESVILGLLGGGAGFALAWALQRSLPSILPADFPRAADLGVDATVVGFAMAITIVASVVFGLAPALRVRRLNLVASLAEDGVSPVGASGRSGVARTRLLIIGGQVAIACVLLVAASLMGRSFVSLLRADRGYDPTRVLLTPVPMPRPGDTPQRRIAVMEQVAERLRRHPGVQQVAFTSESPLTQGGSTSSFSLPSRDAAGAMVPVQASPRLVSPQYFSALGLQLLSGRALEDSDVATSQPVVVVNETFARRFLSDQPLTARIPMGIWGQDQPGTAYVVGIVEDVRYIGSGATTLPEMYFSYRQLPFGLRSSTATLLVRADSDTTGVASAVRHAVRETDAALVAGTVMTLEDRLLMTTLARPRLYAVLLAAFATVALVVTGVGLFGVLSFTVAQRTRELGVRAALGATRFNLVTLVLRQGLLVTAAGALAGVAGAAWLGSFISTLLYGVTAFDAATYVGVPIVLLLVALAACAAPAWRAARLDPLRALRNS